MGQLFERPNRVGRRLQELDRHNDLEYYQDLVVSTTKDREKVAPSILPGDLLSVLFLGYPHTGVGYPHTGLGIPPKVSHPPIGPLKLYRSPHWPYSPPPKTWAA